MMLIGIMVFIAVVILGSSLVVMYQVAFDRSLADLSRTATSQARLLEAVATFDRVYSDDFPEGSVAATLSQIEEAYRSIERAGETGEFVLGRKHGDEIEFLLVSPGDGRTIPASIRFGAGLAEPMYRALTGNAGTMVGRDYDGTIVLAAYQPVAVLDFGIVVKIDLAEIRAPFLRTGGALVVFTVFLTLVGSFLFFKVSNPLIRRTLSSEQRYERAVVGTNDGLWDWNIQTGHDYFSPRWAEILGFEVQELEPVVKTFTDLIHPDDRERVWQEVQSHLDHHAPYDTELRMRKKDGSYVWIQSRGKAVWNLRGKPVHMAGSITDISARKKIEAELVTSEARFRLVFETIEIGTIVIDAKGLIQKMNPAAEVIFGYTSNETTGRNIAMLMPDPDRARHDSYIKNYLDGGDAKIICIGRQVMGLRKNGDKFPMQLEIGKMQIGSDVCFVGSVADLTEFQSLESQLRQSQKLEAVGQLTGGIAHDFNNLLAVVQGNLELLEEDLTVDGDPASEERVALLQAALTASKSGAELIQHLLAFSRKQTLQPRITCLNDLVRRMENLLRRTLGETIQIRFGLQSSAWKLYIDPAQLESALLNLALNARDAMPEGGVLTIKRDDVTLNENYVAAHPGSKIGDFIMLTINDTGVGMTPRVMEKVFEPFFTTKGVGKGSGLGLSMVRGFVEQSGGHVDIFSELGGGTSIKLYLPRSREDKIPEKSTGIVSYEGGPETILVVEDQEAVRRMTVRMLERLGYQVLEASNGTAAIKVCETKGPIDLLLSDVILPGGMDGPHIANAVRKTVPGIKVLLMSGFTEDTVIACGEDPQDPLLSKPFSLQELATLVRETLAQSGQA